MISYLQTMGSVLDLIVSLVDILKWNEVSAFLECFTQLVEEFKQKHGYLMVEFFSAVLYLVEKNPTTLNFLRWEEFSIFHNCPWFLGISLSLLLNLPLICSIFYSIVFSYFKIEKIEQIIYYMLLLSACPSSYNVVAFPPTQVQFIELAWVSIRACSCLKITSVFLEKNSLMKKMLMRWVEFMLNNSDLTLTSTSFLANHFLHTTRASISLE